MWAIGLTILSPIAAWFAAGPLFDRDGTRETILLMATVSAAALAAALWVVFYSGLSALGRVLALVGAVALGFGLWFLFPPTWNGAMQISGFRYRFAPTAEERVAAYAARNPVPAPDADADGRDAEATKAGPGDWPGLLGPERNGKALGARIRTDWEANPPAVLWRHPVGPGWGGFSVVGDRCFTLEQRGEMETVACYDANTGAPLWTHGEETRFERIEPNGGDGPASTPTFHEGAVYSMGATGVVTCCDARTGELRWKRELIPANAESITWGLACSPLVVDGVVVVLPGAAAGENSAAMGLDAATGGTVWKSGDSPASYCSPVVAELDGVRQFLAFEGAGLRGVSIDGRTLWEIPWANDAGVNAAVPIAFGGDRVFFSSSYGAGSAVYQIALSAAGDWEPREVWTNPNRFKLKFNDGILRDGFVYGLDERILTGLDLKDGERVWREARFGYGQLLLLGTTGGEPALLVTSEDGDLILFDVSPDGADELARYSEAAGANLLSGACWNHAAFARGRLYWRNGSEAVCVQLEPDASTN